jgi:photosystem II stability/assembly factor-like uncharacterized protein
MEGTAGSHKKAERRLISGASPLRTRIMVQRPGGADDPSTILTTTDGGSTWTIYQFGFYIPLTGVSQIDAETATVTGGAGIILRTTDGGNNWVQQVSGTFYDLLRVSFTDANTGTTVGQFGTILRTTDGGEHWVPQESGTPELLAGVSFTDTKPRHGLRRFWHHLADNRRRRDLAG